MIQFRQQLGDFDFMAAADIGVSFVVFVQTTDIFSADAGAERWI